MLLIITSDKDFATDYLLVKLIELGLPYFRLNSEELQQASASISISNDEVGRFLTLNGGRSLNLDHITSVWYRRAIRPIPPVGLSSSEQIFIAGELRHFWSGLLIESSVFWVSEPQDIQLAEYKLLQLQLARQIGFSVPDTLISNKPEELRGFVSQIGQVICKPIFHGRFVDKGDESPPVY